MDPTALVPVRLDPLLRLTLHVGPPVEGPAFDAAPAVPGHGTAGRDPVEGLHNGGTAMLVPVVGGHFTGPRLRGRVEGGHDRATRLPDGSLRLDVQVTLRTDDGDRLALHYLGWRWGPPEVLAAITRGEDPDPARYHLRVAGTVEAPGIGWLDRRCVVGTGRRPADGPVYDLHLVT